MTTAAKNYEIIIDGQTFMLTTDHAASSHGIPVLVGADGVAMGPADTCRLVVESASGEAIYALRSAGFEFDDARPDVGEFIAECEVAITRHLPDADYASADLAAYVRACWPTNDEPADVAAAFLQSIMTQAD